QPVDHCSIRVTNENGDEISEGNIGCIEIKGDNVTQGYYNDHISTVQVLSSSGWLKTGDMGFLSKGSLYITGRQKDVFFWNGQNYYPQDIEQIAAGVEGVELNKIAIVGSFNETMSRDEVFAFVAHRGDLK